MCPSRGLAYFQACTTAGEVGPGGLRFRAIWSGRILCSCSELAILKPHELGYREGRLGGNSLMSKGDVESGSVCSRVTTVLIGQARQALACTPMVAS